MADLGRAALVVAFGLAVYALVAGSLRGRGQRRRRLALSAQNALLAASRPTVVAAVVLWSRSGGATSPSQYVAAHTSRDLPIDVRAVARSGAARRARCCSGCSSSPATAALAVVAQPRAAARPRRLGGARARRASPRFFSFMLVVRLEPVRDAAARRRRRRDDAEPAEPVHARPPADALPRLRRARVPFAFAMGALLSRPHRRALDRRRRAAGRSPPGCSSGSASCSARTGPTSRSAGAATTPGIRSRTPR